MGCPYLREDRKITPRFIYYFCGMDNTNIARESVGKCCPQREFGDLEKCFENYNLCEKLKKTNNKFKN